MSQELYAPGTGQMTNADSERALATLAELIESRPRASSYEARCRPDRTSVRTSKNDAQLEKGLNNTGAYNAHKCSYAQSRFIGRRPFAPRRFSCSARTQIFIDPGTSSHEITRRR